MKRGKNLYVMQLSFRLFVLGNSNEGECILLVVYADEKVVYCAVVDSFYNGDMPAAKVVLDKYSINRIDHLYWTHPHDDHTKGLIDLINVFKPSVFFLPSHLLDLRKKSHNTCFETLSAVNEYCKNAYMNINDYEEITECVYGAVEYINEFKGYRLNSKDVEVIELSSEQNAYQQFFTNLNDAVRIPFTIKALAPCNSLTRSYYIQGKVLHPNDYSLVLDIKIGDFNIVLTGDASKHSINIMLNELLDDCYDRPNILKIPHHGSKDSLNINKIFGDEKEKYDICVTTAKRSSKLPNDQALGFYKLRTDSLFRIDHESKDMAVWGIDVDILKGHAVVFETTNYCCV